MRERTAYRIQGQDLNDEAGSKGLDLQKKVNELKEGTSGDHGKDMRARLGKPETMIESPYAPWIRQVSIIRLGRIECGCLWRSETCQGREMRQAQGIKYLTI